MKLDWLKSATISFLSHSFEIDDDNLYSCKSFLTLNQKRNGTILELGDYAMSPCSDNKI